jgi:hypothetical protein
MRYALLIVLLLCCACAKPAYWSAVPEASSLAVAHFVHPEHDWELMAGILPEEPSVIDRESLQALDEMALSILGKRPGRRVLRQAMVRQCEEIVTSDKERRRFDTLEYWKAVGQCMKADYLLVPFVSRWQERASLTMDLYLIETATGQVRRYHFEEEQQGLAENLLQGRRFVKRQGRWVTPLEIAAEALEEGTMVLGL